jgi:hypothetical protein
MMSGSIIRLRAPNTVTGEPSVLLDFGVVPDLKPLVERARTRVENDIKCGSVKYHKPATGAGGYLSPGSLGYGAAFSYRSNPFEECVIPAEVEDLKSVVECRTSTQYDHVLVKVYPPNTKSSLNWHADVANDGEPGKPMRVACVTSGCARPLLWRKFHQHSPCWEFTPAPNSLWLMTGNINVDYQHCVVQDIGSIQRITFTFRQADVVLRNRPPQEVSQPLLVDALKYEELPESTRTFQMSSETAARSRTRERNTRLQFRIQQILRGRFNSNINDTLNDPEVKELLADEFNDDKEWKRFVRSMKARFGPKKQIKGKNKNHKKRKARTSLALTQDV